LSTNQIIGVVSIVTNEISTFTKHILVADTNWMNKSME